MTQKQDSCPTGIKSFASVLTIPESEALEPILTLFYMGAQSANANFKDLYLRNNVLLLQQNLVAFHKIY